MNNSRKKSLIIIFLYGFAIQFGLSSCATLFSGTSQQISFNSFPQEAEVVAVMKNGSEKIIGKTPCTMEIKKKTRKINFTKDGFYTETYDLRQNASIHWGYWADLGGMIFFGAGIIPAIVDLVNEAYWVYPEQIKTELKKK
jgi:hypothetical protein